MPYWLITEKLIMSWRKVLQPGAVMLTAILGSANAQAQYMQIPKPSAGLMPNPAQGKRLYGAYCASCHGPDLKGSDKGPPMLHKVYEPSHHGDAAF